jgi:peptide-methionine (S)-S-oxide reductase
MELSITKISTGLLTLICMMTFCTQNHAVNNNKSMESNKENSIDSSPESRSGSGNTDTATFGAGCFWCVESIFQRMEGVSGVKSGYSGGTVKNPSYKEVCNGTTGHAEVVQITYDKSKVSFDELLEVFWKTHDPTTLNRQGNDIGTQYRSVIFYNNDEQKQIAEKYKTELNASGAFANPVITEISPLTNFYSAEDYHQNYYNLNKEQSYCQFVIQPKIEKFEKVFKGKLKH